MIEKIRYIAEHTGFGSEATWFPVGDIYGYESEEQAREAIKLHKKTFYGKMQYRLSKVTTIKEFLKVK